MGRAARDAGARARPERLHRRGGRPDQRLSSARRSPRRRVSSSGQSASDAERRRPALVRRGDQHHGPGHPLEFGTFVTPLNSQGSTSGSTAGHDGDPLTPVRLAQLERRPASTSSFQDHPYQPRFHETWTLLRLGGGADGAHPVGAQRHQRPDAAAGRPRQGRRESRPAVARAARAGPRCRLLLGRDGVDGHRSPRPVPRSMRSRRPSTSFAASGPRASGLHCAPTEPTTASTASTAARPHNIPIWVGGGKPRMLDLTGRLADGWVIPGGNSGLADLSTAAAPSTRQRSEAGRDPREIRRIANVSGRFAARDGGFLDGPPDQWVEDLLPVVVDHGVGTSSSPPTIRTRSRRSPARSCQPSARRSTPSGPSVAPRPGPSRAASSGSTPRRHRLRLHPGHLGT